MAKFVCKLPQERLDAIQAICAQTGKKSASVAEIDAYLDRKADYDSEAGLRDSESGAAYERMVDAWAHSVEPPPWSFEAQMEEVFLQDFEAQLRS